MSNKTKYDIEFVCIDDWNRAMYLILELKVYLSDVNHLWDWSDDKEDIDNYYKENISGLTIHGKSIDDDPLGTNIKSTITLNII